MSVTNISDRIISFFIKKTMNQPHKSLYLIVRFVRFITKNPKIIGYFDSFLEYLKWNEDTIKRIYDSTNPLILSRFFKIYITRMHITGPSRRSALQEKLQIRTPDIIIGELTHRCNLKCTGCYSKINFNQNIDFIDWNNIIAEAKQLGIFNVFWSGGEPLLEHRLLFKLAKQHPDIWFSVFTNGTLIDENIARQCLLSRNVSFLVSINGTDNDRYRGKGSYKQIFKSMSILKKQGIPFGVSVTVFRDNIQNSTNDTFIKECIKAGANFFMFFPFLPKNIYEHEKYAITPMEREHLYKAVLSIRSRFRISAFYSHLNLMGACAGGGRLIYINVNGDIQPCPFTPFATHNVKDGLLNALNSNLHLEYSKRDINHKDPLSMCYRLDHPLDLADILNSSNAYPVDNLDKLFFLKPPESVLKYSSEWKLNSERLRSGMDGREMIKKLEVILNKE